MLENKQELEHKKFGPMTPKEREKFNDLEKRILKMETMFKTIGQVAKWIAIILGFVSAVIGIAVKIAPYFNG